MLQEANVTVYAIGIGVRRWPFFHVRAGGNLLTEMAEITGRRYLPAANVNELPGIMQKIDIPLPIRDRVRSCGWRCGWPAPSHSAEGERSTGTSSILALRLSRTRAGGRIWPSQNAASTDYFDASADWGLRRELIRRGIQCGLKWSLVRRTRRMPSGTRRM